MKHIFVTLLLCSLAEAALSQGCSDAGFCTIGDIHAAAPDSVKEKKNKLSALLTNGIGDQGVFVSTPGLQYETNLNAHFSFQSKLTGNYATGNLGTATGPGDAFLSCTYRLNANSANNTSFTMGTKLPLSNGDIRYAGKPLPMQYQSSLGTIDLIVGYKLSVRWFSANLAWQQPLTGTNRNTFLPQYLANPAAYAYAPGNDFNRKGDVLLRLACQLAWKKNWNWNASVLNIYHLGEDTYIDGNISNSPLRIAGSKGLTVNITSLLSYKVSSALTLGVSGGVPLLVRKVRPDGLTRAFALTPEIHFNF